MWTKLLVEWMTLPTAVDRRIADKAKTLERQLAASFELWPQRNPHTLEDLVSWAFKLARGYKVTELAVRELVDLRADASHRVRSVVGAARDHFDTAADLISPIVTETWEIIGDQAVPARAAAAMVSLQQAVGYVRECLDALDTLAKGWS